MLNYGKELLVVGFLLVRFPIQAIHFKIRNFQRRSQLPRKARFAAFAGADHVYSQSSWARLAGVNQKALAVLLVGLREMLR